MAQLGRGNLIQRLKNRDGYRKLVSEQGFHYVPIKGAGRYGKRAHPLVMSLLCARSGHDWYPEYATTGTNYDAMNSGGVARCIWCGRVWDEQGRPRGWTPDGDSLSRVELARMMVSLSRGRLSDQEFRELDQMARTEPDALMGLLGKT
jgi:hypothetical protein